MTNQAEEYVAAKTQGAFADLSARCKIHVAGADRVRYLNGQVTADVRRLSPREALYGCVLTAKGKMCADAWITAAPREEGDRSFLRIDAEPVLRDALMARLERYIVADDVTLRDATEDETLLHVITFGKSNRLNPETPPPVTSTRFGYPGADFFLPRESAEHVRAQLSSRFAVIDEQVLEVLRVEAGIPRWGFELDENTIPVEAGLDRTAIDYSKGCYIGQEIISRLKSIGHVNRQLRGLISRDGSPLRKGMQLLGDEGQNAGCITSAVYSFGLEKQIALGYVKRTAMAPVLAVHEEETEHTVDVVELPFIR